ncbi:MAG TPA: deoxyribose-phosphate aldolase [Tissierellia bacterium]|nr:deoxyribose-phosphate aldolase [Tissierellia bacterium]
MTRREMASMIDHTLLKPSATADDIKKLCQEARDVGFATVCVQPSRVALAAEMLRGSGVGVTAVVGFPHGATSSSTKAFEAAQAIRDGADEIDMVINQGALKDGDAEYVLSDTQAVRDATKGHVLKVILETSELCDEEIVAVCRLCETASCDFVKTSTGFSGGGATREAVELMRNSFSKGIKASGGIRTYADAQKFVEAGATRLGASAGMAILKEIEE